MALQMESHTSLLDGIDRRLETVEKAPGRAYNKYREIFIGLRDNRQWAGRDDRRTAARDHAVEMYGRAAEKYRTENARRNRSARYDQKIYFGSPAKAHSRSRGIKKKELKAYGYE